MLAIKLIKCTSCNYLFKNFSSLSYWTDLHRGKPISKATPILGLVVLLGLGFVKECSHCGQVMYILWRIWNINTFNYQPLDLKKSHKVHNNIPFAPYIFTKIIGWIAQYHTNICTERPCNRRDNIRYHTSYHFLLWSTFLFWIAWLAWTRFTKDNKNSACQNSKLKVGKSKKFNQI